MDTPEQKHKPGPMRPITAVEVAATAAERFRRQYEHWSDEDKFADGRTKGEAISRLNSEAHTPENITSILNKGWAHPSCSCCGEGRPVVVAFSAEWSDETYELCAECINRAAALVRGAVL